MDEEEEERRRRTTRGEEGGRQEERGGACEEGVAVKRELRYLAINVKRRDGTHSLRQTIF